MNIMHSINSAGRIKLLAALLFICSAVITPVISKPVTPEIALKAATGFVMDKKYLNYKSYDINQEAQQLDLLHIFTYYDPGSGFNNALYVYGNSKGFVIVSGDDVTMPILGYSFESYYSPSDMPPHVLYWLNSLKDEVARLSLTTEASPQIAKQWDRYVNYNKSKENSPAGEPEKLAKVEPLVATRWDQSPYYNQLCPFDSYYNDRTVTGCVATAMAQVMKYNKYPAKGTGYYSYYHQRFGNLSANFANTTYNWNNMPVSINSNNSDIATLMYHCGVSVDMNYGVAQTGGSGAAGAVTVHESMKKYFGYPESVKFVKKRDYSDQEWKNLLRKELDEKRPMYYEGTGDGGGHAFVLDGYDGEYFHFNWGWSGQYDGYFLLSSLIPAGTGTGGGGGNFTSNQAAVIGIVPPGGSGGSGGEDPKKANIVLNSNIYVLTDPILVNGEIKVNADIWNNSKNTFKCAVCAALFDSDGQFVDYIEIKTGIELLPDYHYTNGITFTKENLFGVYPGNYFVGIYVKPEAGNWEYVNSDKYYGFVQVYIQAGYYNTSLGMYKDLEVSNPVYIGQSFSVKFTPANYGDYNFTGDLSVDLFDTEGNFVKNIGTSQNFQLISNYYQEMTIQSSGLNVAQGKYLLAVFARPSGGNWVLINPMAFRNPVFINVALPPLQADKYESNNNESTSYKFNISFNGSNASFDTDGSNLHVSTDNDYYSITLPAGFDYRIKPKVQDYYSADDGKDYTGDVIFSVKDKANWSEVWDDYPATDLIVRNGGTVIFKVQPYYETESGSYKLEVDITRIGPTSAGEITGEVELIVTPNPSAGMFQLVLPNNIESLQVVDAAGKTLILYTSDMLAQGKLLLDLSEYSQGVYHLIVNSGGNTITKTLVIER